MSYKFSTGSVRKGDSYFEDDRQGQPTYIDFGYDTIALRPSGTAILYAESDKIGIGTTSPAEILHIEGADSVLRLDDTTSNYRIDLEVAGGLKLMMGTTTNSDAYMTLMAHAGLNKLDTVTRDFHLYGNNTTTGFYFDESAGKFGIGTDAPDYTLDVAGDMGVDEKIYHNGDADTYIAFSGPNQINLVANGHSFLKYDGAIKINNANRDRNTQIMADDGNVVLHVDAGDNFVGIGTTTPEAYLDIKNTTDDGATNRTMIQMYNYRADDANENDWAPTSIDFKVENVAGCVKGATARIATVLAPVGTDHNSTEGEKSSALIFSTMDDATLAEAARINNLGYLGLGTTNPSSKLQVSGSVQFNVTVFTANDTLDGTHHVAVGDCNSADVTLTLPAATSAITGRQYIIKRADSSNSNAQAFVIAPGSGDAIDGSTSNITGIDDGTSHTLICIGTSGWILVDKYVGI